jgi:hypothetical protein
MVSSQLLVAAAVFTLSNVVVKETTAFSLEPPQEQQRPVSQLASSTGSRRGFLAGTTASIISASILATASPAAAQAKDDIFKPNPLTNGVLEQLRIWEQSEVDDLRYGGELAPGDAGNKGKVDAYPRLLVPILEMAKELESVANLVRNPASLSAAQKLLKQSKYDKVAFKRTFNAFADNIYYADPDRANAYLGGGATPKNEQSLAYLLRNDILTNVENLQVEIDYLLQHPEEDTADMYEYSRIATSAMMKYLVLVPPAELEKAKELIATDR